MINGRLILKGIIQLQSPALIGCGRAESTDIDLIKDSDGKPYIPATSLIGTLRTNIKPDGINLDSFWGYTNNTDSAQSAIRCEDLNIVSNGANAVEIRDGIKIDSKNGIVESGAKYDYEIIPKGVKFHIKMEVAYGVDNKETYAKMLKTIEHNLSSGMISVGAKTNSGLGSVKLTDAHIYDFDYSSKEAVLLWLKQDFDKKHEIKGIEPYATRYNDFVMNITLKLKTSLIVRSYSSSPDAPDAVHIKSGNEEIIPGTSLKGAIRARAERIENTIHNNNQIVDELFGFVIDKKDEAQAKGKKKGDAKKGKIRIDEVTLPKFISELQTRIKIDRFTGGTIEAALFETMPLFALKEKDEEIKNIRITIKKCEPYEAGLMLLVLKDLWTGDLAVGGEKNIGRGVFEGVRAEIVFGGKRIVIDKELVSLSEQDKQSLERLLEDFKQYPGGQ